MHRTPYLSWACICRYPINDVTKKDWKIEERYSCLLVFCVGIRDLFLNPVGSSLKLWFLEIRLKRKD